MVLILILGFYLSIYAVPPPLRDGRAMLSQAQVDMQSIDETIWVYMVRHQSRKVPTLETLIMPDEKGVVWLLGYDAIPQDPWGNPYMVRPGESRRDYAVISWGPDGFGETEDDLSSRR